MQPETHLHFLSRFLETSMFLSFVDGKATARWLDRDPVQQLFDSRLERERLCDTEQEEPRQSRYKKCASLLESGTSNLHQQKHEDACVRREDFSDQRKRTRFTGLCLTPVNTCNICVTKQQLTAALTSACRARHCRPTPVQE